MCVFRCVYFLASVCLCPQNCTPILQMIMCCLSVVLVCCNSAVFMCLYKYFPLLPCRIADYSNAYSRDLSGVQKEKSRGEAKVFLWENEGKENM